MFCWRTATLWALSCCYSIAIAAQVTRTPQAPAGSLQDTEAGKRIEHFIKTYNSGDLAQIRGFITSESDSKLLAASPDKAQDMAAYWLNVFSQYGPVRFHSISRVDGYETEAWTYGSASRAWLGLDFTVAETSPHKVVDYGVVRGSRPEVAPQRIPSNRLAGYLADYLRDLDRDSLFSGAFLIAKDGKLVFRGACGQANRELKVANQLDTKFYIASLTKMFTAVGILQLAEQGRLSLLDPIRKYLPDYPEPIASKVTIRHLLTHTSGIELDEIESFNDAIQHAGTMQDIYAAQLEYLPQLPNYGSFALPNRFNYSNEEYDLLGVIIERVSKQSYDDYLNQHVFEPAQMRQTAALSPTQPVTMAATGYTRRKPAGGYAESPQPSRSFMQLRTRPAGGHYSTVDDLLRFYSALLGGKLLPRSPARQLTTPQVTIHETENDGHYYGYGFQIEKSSGVTKVGHGGAYFGASARFDVYPDLGYTVIVLANEEWVANNVADHIRECIGGL